MTEFIRKYLHRRMLLTFIMGFASGLPLLAIGSTLQAWMTDLKVDLTTIGLFSLVGLPYTLKFIWAPALDRWIPPFLGRRRGWMLITQIALFISLIALGFSQPAQKPLAVALLAFIVAFFSATQDIVIDAYRRESLNDEEQGLGSSFYTIGYRFAMMVSSAFALWLADRIPWQQVYLILGIFMVVGLVSTIYAPEPESVGAPRNLKEAVVEPFKDFFRREHAIGILAFILFYKLGDTLASAMTMPFYLKLGYTKTEVGAIVKVFGLIAMMVGGLLGGIFTMKMGIHRSLWICGILQAVSTLGFSTLTMAETSLSWLASVIFFENLTGGMGTTAYSAYMAILTNRKFTATQYALLTSLMGVPRVVFSSASGALAKNLGWFHYFVFCTLIALPGLLLLKMYGPKKEVPPSLAV